MTEDLSEKFRRRELEREQHTLRRWKVRSIVLTLHVLVLGIPLLWSVLDKFFSPPKVNAFRVKIGPKELSHAPEVGRPERSRPGGAPEPEVVLPRPEPPVPVPAPEPDVVIPKPKPKPKPRPKPRPRKVVKKTVKKPVKKPVRKPVKKQTPRPVRKKRRDLQAEVYRPPAGSNELRVTGRGRNFNRNVPLGSRDRGQVKGKADHRTPGGGLSEEMEKYNQRAGMYLKTVWIQPPKSLLGTSLPAVTIEIAVSADGRVLAKRILKTSGVQAMDESVKNLLERLDRMPAPPRNTVIQFILQTDD